MFNPRGCGFNPWPRSVGEGSGIAVSCGVGCRSGSNLALLWHRPVATALIQPLAWGLPYAVGAALKWQKKKKEKKKKKKKRRRRRREKSLCPHVDYTCAHQHLQRFLLPTSLDSGRRCTDLSTPSVQFSHQLSFSLSMTSRTVPTNWINANPLRRDGWALGMLTLLLWIFRFHSLVYSLR